MRDIGDAQTEKLLKELETRLTKEYAQAAKEVQDKLDDYLRRFNTKDKIWQQRVDAGKATQKEYEQWRIGQIAVGKRWEAMKDTLAEDMHHANVIARGIVDEYKPEVYALNHNFATYNVEHDGRVDTSYVLYNRAAVEKLAQNEEILPPIGKQMKQRIAAGLDVAWQKGQIQSVTMQGILQGESIPNLSKRIANTLGESNHKSTIRYARTSVTAAQNRGREDAYKRAESLGVNMMREWVATFDNRTRHEHRILDGQKRAIDEPFEADGMEIMFPGDPECPYPEMIWNCRCRTVAAVDGWEDKIGALRSDEAVGGMSYEEWLEAKPEYQSITHQQEVAEAMRRSYINELYGGSGEDREENANNHVTIDLTNTKTPDSALQAATDYAERMSDKDREKFNNIFKQATFNESENGSYYDPITGEIAISKDSADGIDAFHESTHWFDYKQDYTITEEWLKREYVYDNDDNIIGKKFVSEVRIVEEHAPFCHYISHEWSDEKRDKITGEVLDSLQTLDMRNMEKKIGLSGIYGLGKEPETLKADMDAFKKYFENMGVSRQDKDFVHLSDFMSAMSYDANLGSLVTGGHDYRYWTRGDQNRVTEITAGYNLLRATGREDLIAIERDIAPNLMNLIEQEWAKIW